MSRFSTDRISRQYRAWRRKLVPLASRYWHHGSAWLAGPLLVGLTAVFLAIQSEYASNAGKLLFAFSPLAPLVAMPLGFALIFWVSTHYFPGIAGSGVPQTIAALNENSAKKKSHFLSLHLVVGKVMLNLASIAVGASLGREGPTVQIGAAIMHFFYGRGPFRTPEQRRILIVAGGAAGIAAAFNTPLAGIMFAIEELSRKHVFNANSSTLITVVGAGLISLFLLGNYTYFGASTTSLDWKTGALALPVCGLIGGLAGGMFSRAVLSLSALAGRRVRRPVAFAALCGVAVALVGLLTDGVVLGTGYESTQRTLADEGVLPWYFGIAKLVATLLSVLSGIPGGLFAPSLAVGAGIGDNVAALLPAVAPHSAIVLLVMAAYLSGVTREPLTSFVIMMEMTGSHHMLLPLMTATLVANGMSKIVCPMPLYQALAERFLPPQANNRAA
jgi:H+/Cl- antiporter ClcA